MSILDTFTILFNSNVDQVREGEEEATTAGKKLASELEATGHKGAAAAHEITEANSKLAKSFDVIKEHAGEMASRLIEHALEVAAAFQALFAVEKIVDNFFETSEASDQLGERAKSLGVNVEQLDAWGNAAKRVGGSAEAFGESLINVNRQMARMEATGKSRILPFFEELGVSMTDAQGHEKDLFALLPELAKATEGKSKQESAGALRGIGFDEGTIRLLQRGGKEIDELISRQKMLGLVTAEDAETAERFNIEWDDIKQIFHSLTVEADTYLLPTLQTLLTYVEEFVEFLRDHKDLVVGFFIALGAAALYAATAFGLLDFALAIFSPITLIVAAVAGVIAAFALLYEDIMVYSRGGKSAIGELAKRFPLVAEAIKFISTAVKELREIADESFAAIREWIDRIPEGFRQWEHIISEATESWLPDLMRGMGGIGKRIELDLHDIEKRFAKTFGDAIPGTFQAFVDTIKAILHLFSDLFVDPINAINNFDKAIDKILEHLEKRFSIVHRIAEDMRDLGSALNWIATKTGAADFSKPKTKEEIKEERIAQKEKEADDNRERKQWADWAKGGAVPGKPGAVPSLPAAQAMIAATQAPIMAQTTASLGAGGTVNHNTVSVGPTTINATTNDPAGIAAAVDNHMREHVSNALNQMMADGVSH
jgi:TP901 family phage tail tape measure protein